MHRATRFLAVLLFPLCYLGVGYASSVYIGGDKHSIAFAALGDIGAMLLPSVLIYLVSLLFVRRALRELTVGELAAGSLLVALLAPTLIFVAMNLLYARGNSHFADEMFFFVVPSVPPVVACWLALRVVLAWHRLRVRVGESSAVSAGRP